LLGYQDDPAKVNMEKIENLSFEQIKNFYQTQIKNKPVTIIIFGDPKLIDLKTIKSKYGKINKLSNNTLFSKLSM
jgi:predicted Zn-dependent peptidase